MKELSLKELKEIEFELLQLFDSFCTENNIKYYLSHGTLLGAIRYQKFIPWDDDIDLLIPREDYDKMITLFKDDERYQLFAFEKNENYRFPYAKLCDMTTRKIEFDHNNGVDLGVDIDLFPLDAWDNDIEVARKEVKSLQKNMLCLNMIRMKKPNTTNYVKKIIGWIAILFCKISGSKHYIKNIIKIGENSNAKSDYLGCKVWCVYGERGIIPAEAFAESIEVEFEGQMFPAPKGYDTYLTCLYGDYLPEPPKEKQKTHHNFKAYKL